MERVAYMFVIIAVGMAVSALMTIWSRRETRIRALSVIMLAAWVPSLAAMAIETLGWHKPIWAAWRLKGEFLVLSSKLVEGEGIYLYLDTGAGEPRAIKVPWSDDVAQKLQDALRESFNNGNRGAIMEYEHSWDDNPPQFHALPQPPIPMPKGQEDDPPARYDREA